ncbi:MAG: choice-of-anchor D domain-containing protein [Planctomycetes bacterium]|nr:choice-of-anchor D domain-containing protein [Planctomycetota bacterium]
MASLAAVASTALAAQYLPPTYNNTGATGDWCANIQINTTPPFDSGAIADSATDYNYHVGVGASFTPGQAYTMTVLNNPSWDGGIGAWLDLNGDGDYADANEFLGATAVLTPSQSGTINFTVPVATPAQPATRFRVIQVYNAVPNDPVGIYGFGQCEEYDAAITPLGDPEIQVRNPSLVAVQSTGTTNLGNTDIGGPTNYTFTVDNLGATNPLTVSGIACAPSGVGNVTVTASPALTPASPIPAGNSATFIVAVTPTAIGPYEFTITITNNDADEGTYTVIVQGTGADPTPGVQAPAPATANSPLLITEMTSNTGDDSLEIQNTSASAFDATGWQVIISDDYVDINIANPITQTLGNFTAGQVQYWTDGATNPWGNNIFWDPSGAGWIMLVDTAGNIRDFVAFIWTSTDIANMSVNAGGFTGLTPGPEWSGNGVPDNGNFYARVGTQDNNDATDWQDNGATGTLGTTNGGLTLPFSTLGGATLGGADPAWTGSLQVGDALDVTFTATDSNPAQTLNFTITVTGGTLTGAQAGFNESFPYTPAGGTTPHSASLTGTAAMVGTIELTVQVSDGTLTDTITYTLTIAAAQEMDVLRGATPVADGGTDTVAIVLAGSNLTYTIQNTGGLDLLLTGTPLVAVTAGTNVSSVIVTATPTTPVPASGSTNFTVNVVPVAAGAYDFTISIANNDPNENPYNFTVSGNAVSNVPPVVANQTGSNWVDAGGGLFTLTVNPGAAINDTLEATDATPDNMTVTVTNPATALAGLTAQPADVTTPTAGPISMTWTGTAAASNTPGNYDWLISVNDGTSSTNITARIIVVDVAPQHTAATGISGDGSAGTPYLTTYAENDPATLTVNLANVTDGNTGQVLNLSNVAQSSGPTTGSGFTFSLVGGVLSVAPSATLVANDVGTQVFSMDIDDGTNTVTVNVSILVLGNSGAVVISNTSPLPAGTVGAVYTTVTLTATGGTGPYTYSVVSGALPAGLSLSATGDITGTPTVAVTANFTVRAVDSLNDSGTKAFSLTINAAGGGSGGGGGGGGGGCAAGTSSNTGIFLLLSLLGLVALAFRVRTRKA